MTVIQFLRLVWRSGALFVLTGAIALFGRVHRSLAGGVRGKQIWNEYYYGPWGRLLLKAFHINLLTEFDEAPNPYSVKLVVSNHSSPLDIAILAAMFQSRFVAQIEIAKWPIIGFGTSAAGGIFVDREYPRSGAKVIMEIRKALCMSQDTVAIFPEAVASQGDVVREFHKGGFLAAKNADVYLVPVGIAYPSGAEWREETFVQHLIRVAVNPSLTVAVRVGNGYKMKASPAEEAKKAQLIVQQLTYEARDLLNAPER